MSYIYRHCYFSEGYPLKRVSILIRDPLKGGYVETLTVRGWERRPEGFGFDIERDGLPI